MTQQEQEEGEEEEGEEGGKKWDQQPAGFTHGSILPSAGKGILVQERQVQNCSYGKPQLLLWLKAQISFRVFPAA